MAVVLCLFLLNVQKCNVFSNQSTKQTAVVGLDVEAMKLCGDLQSRQVRQRSVQTVIFLYTQPLSVLLE